MQGIKSLSLIIPAYKEEKNISKSIVAVENILKKMGVKYELIIVVDGFVDNTFKNASKKISKKVKVLGYKKNKGKGYAIRYGIIKSKGDVVGFIDAGLDIDPAAIPLLLEYLKINSADIVLGSKLHPDSIINYPLPRKLLSWCYRKCSQVLFGFDIKDTQVGLKLYRGDVARDIFSKLVINGFAFDIEVLALAHALGYRKIIEAPIKLRFNNFSTITSYNFWQISLATLLDTLSVFYRLKIAKSYGKIEKNKVRKKQKK